MERIRALGVYQKIILILLCVLTAVFAVVYGVTTGRRGYLYQGAILIPREEADATVYSGKVRGTQTIFTVSPEGAVTCQVGARTYGPYVLKEDSTAIPQDSELRDLMTGIELRCGDEIRFRGGVVVQGATKLFFDESGELYNVSSPAYVTKDSADGAGTAAAGGEPSVGVILDLVRGPSLTHLGDGRFYILGVVFCIAGAVEILFTDELYRFHLAFRVRNPEAAEPSDWEIAGRYFAWTVMPIAALVVFCVGLKG